MTLPCAICHQTIQSGESYLDKPSPSSSSSPTTDEKVHKFCAQKQHQESSKDLYTDKILFSWPDHVLSNLSFVYKPLESQVSSHAGKIKYSAIAIGAIGVVSKALDVYLKRAGGSVTFVFGNPRITQLNVPWTSSLRVVTASTSTTIEGISRGLLKGAVSGALTAIALTFLLAVGYAIKDVRNGEQPSRQFELPHTNEKFFTSVKRAAAIGAGIGGILGALYMGTATALALRGIIAQGGSTRLSYSPSRGPIGFTSRTFFGRNL